MTALRMLLLVALLEVALYLIAPLLERARMRCVRRSAAVARGRHSVPTLQAVS